MAQLYSNENFPRQVVEKLRELQHDLPQGGWLRQGQQPAALHVRPARQGREPRVQPHPVALADDCAGFGHSISLSTAR